MNGTVPDEAFAALRENLGQVLQVCALMRVISPASVHDEPVIQAACSTPTPVRSS